MVYERGNCIEDEVYMQETRREVLEGVKFVIYRYG